MKIYPGIYKGKDGGVRFYFNESTFCFNDSSAFEDWIADKNKNEHKKDKNITVEYLANTYGEVRSKEHAEFIVKLAEVNGFKLKGYARNSGYFYTWRLDDGSLFFSFCKDEKVAMDDDEKLITIPLPPKEKPMVSQKECPAVGDEVLIDSTEHLSELENFNGEKCKVIGICEHKGKNILTISHKSLGVAALIMGEWIKKPPTPEKELESKLSALMNSDSCGSCGDIAKAIINGEIEGLEYKHD